MEVLIRHMNPDLLVVTHLSVALPGWVLVPLILKAYSCYSTRRQLLRTTKTDDDVAMAKCWIAYLQALTGDCRTMV